MQNDSGKAGELHVAGLLCARGYTLLTKNYHSRYGEIDIIVRDAQYIVFVEVKTRGQKQLFAPQQAVTVTKQKKLVQTALLYLQVHPEFADLQPRFDVAAVITQGTPAQIVDVQYFTGAFDGGGLF